MHGLNHETIDSLRLLQEAGNVQKAFTQPAVPATFSGINFYNLEAGAKEFYPSDQLTPLRNELPRVKSRGGNAVMWKAFTGINTANVLPGVSEGNRGGIITTTMAEYIRPYKGMGFEDYVTFEADYTSQGSGIDVIARAGRGLLQSLHIAEERVILTGNYSLALGSPVAPTGVAQAPSIYAGVGQAVATPSASTLAAATHFCRVVALTGDGLLLSSITGGVVGSVARTNADSTVDNMGGGSSNLGAESASVTPAANQSIQWAVADVRGAVGYAWYTGTVAGAANLKLTAITSINRFEQSTLPAGGNQLASAITADNSRNLLVFDGMLTQLFDVAGNAYYKTVDGALITANANGTIDILDTALYYFFNTWKVTPHEILTDARTADDISKAIQGAAGGPKLNVNINAGATGLTGGTMINAYLNRFWGSGTAIPIKVHPSMPAGTIMFRTKSLPYAAADVPAAWQIETRQEYYALEWPKRTRKHELGVYVDETLKGYIPFAQGIIRNIKNTV